MQRIGVGRILGQDRPVDLLGLDFHPRRLVVNGDLDGGEDGNGLVGRSIGQAFDPPHPEVPYAHRYRVAPLVEDDAEGVLGAGFQAVDMKNEVGRFVETLLGDPAAAGETHADARVVEVGWDVVSTGEGEERKRKRKRGSRVERDGVVGSQRWWLG